VIIPMILLGAISYLYKDEATVEGPLFSKMYHMIIYSYNKTNEMH